MGVIVKQELPIKMFFSVSTMLLTLTLVKLSTSSDAGLVSHPNGAVVPQYTPEVTAARLQHLQALQADVKEDKRGRGLDLALLLGLVQGIAVVVVTLNSVNYALSTGHVGRTVDLSVGGNAVKGLGVFV